MGSRRPTLHPGTASALIIDESINPAPACANPRARGAAVQGFFDSRGHLVSPVIYRKLLVLQAQLLFSRPEFSRLSRTGRGSTHTHGNYKSKVIYTPPTT